MSFSLDLDEASEDSLKLELWRRARAREMGVCDYCGRKPEEPTCKFPNRHNPNVPVEFTSTKQRAE